jgi:hypothetical protein
MKATYQWYACFAAYLARLDRFVAVDASELRDIMAHVERLEIDAGNDPSANYCIDQLCAQICASISFTVLRSDADRDANLWAARMVGKHSMMWQDMAALLKGWVCHGSSALDHERTMTLMTHAAKQRPFRVKGNVLINVVLGAEDNARVRDILTAMDVQGRFNSEQDAFDMIDTAAMRNAPCMARRLR